MISTVSPAATLPRRKKVSAVVPPKHNATASTSLRFAGVWTIAPASATTAYSAWHPKSNSREATTRSPGWNRLTALPTASTRPASSTPRMGCFGLLKPSFRRIGRPNPAGTRSARTRASPELTVVARTLTNTSSSAGTGVGTSWIVTTSGGPYRSQTAAFTTGRYLSVTSRGECHRDA